MALDKVKDYLKQFGQEQNILEFDVTTATVELAAQALGVIPARIAKTLAFKTENGCVLVVAAGDVKVDNAKFKARFGIKAKMLNPDEVIEYTGHAVGGVCPFAIEHQDTVIYTDVSMQRFSTLFPACGSSNSAIELTCEQITDYAKSLGWVDVCKGWQEDNQ